MAMKLGKVMTREHTWEHALPSAQAIALGKHHRFAECHGPDTRQRSLFAECLAGGTRQSGHLCRVFESTALCGSSIGPTLLVACYAKAIAIHVITGK